MTRLRAVDGELRMPGNLVELLPPAPGHPLLTEAAAKLEALFQGRIPDKIGPAAAGDAEAEKFTARFNRLIDFFQELTDFIAPLARGELPATAPPSDHFVAPPLREFHAQLVHLTWQAKQVANGDYSQRLAFLGDFSVAFNAMIISLEQRENILLSLARTDSLTGIHNRISLNDILAAELYRAQRYHHHLAVVIFDIDHFKRINDTFGHQRGDEVLRALAALVRNHLRSTDIFGRWGGEEFLIAAPGVTGVQGRTLAEKVRRLIENHDFAPVRQVTASFGVAAPRPDDTVDELIHRADMALYGAKEAGRNRVELG